MALSIQRYAIAETAAGALQTLTGVQPKVEHGPQYSRVYYSPDKEQKVQSWLEAQLRPQPPGEVRIELDRVILNTALKKALPYAVALLAGGFFLGKVLK
jgi:hypothetical protein